MGGQGTSPRGGTRVGRPRQDGGPRGNGSRRGPTGLCPGVEEEDEEGRNPPPGQGLPEAAGPPRVTLARPRRAGGGEASAQPRPLARRATALRDPRGDPPGPRGSAGPGLSAGRRQEIPAAAGSRSLRARPRRESRRVPSRHPGWWGEPTAGCGPSHRRHGTGESR